MATLSINTPAEGTQVKRRPTITGTGNPRALITLYESFVGTTVWGKNYADSNGNWCIIPDDDLPLGNFGLVVNDGSGWSNNRSVAVSNTLWATEPIIYSPKPDDRVAAKSLVISGKAKPDSTVSVYRSGASLYFGDALVDENGDWAVAAPAGLVPGRYSITAMASIDGSTSGWATDIVFNIVVFHRYAWTSYLGAGTLQAGQIVSAETTPPNSGRNPDGFYEEGQWTEVPDYTKPRWWGRNGTWGSEAAAKRVIGDFPLPQIKKIAVAQAMDADNYKVQQIELDVNNISIQDLGNFLAEAAHTTDSVGPMVCTSITGYDELRADQHYNSTRIPQHQRLARLLLSTMSGQESFGYTVDASQRQAMDPVMLLCECRYPLIVFYKSFPSNPWIFDWSFALFEIVFEYFLGKSGNKILPTQNMSKLPW